MARGINKVIIVGNLGQDPEIRSFPDGGQITTISVATTHAWKDKQTGQTMEHTEWHHITFNNLLAEIAGQYLTKGAKVYIEGSLRTRKWQDKQTGQTRYHTGIFAKELQMLDPKPTTENTHQNHGSAPAPAPAPHPNDFNDFDDDIPF